MAFRTHYDGIAAKVIDALLHTREQFLATELEDRCDALYRFLRERDGWTDWREAVAAVNDAFRQTLHRRRAHPERVAQLLTELDQWVYLRTHDWTTGTELH